MHLPASTYRLQFREGMDFARARALVPYLRDLGIGHLYASPVFTAAPGSTHGYDVIDPNAVEPALGGLDGLEALSADLKAAGMGLTIDIVPNHMAFTLANPWLADVLRHGRASAYADHFDIDWSAGRLRLPWLGDGFDALADAGEITVDGDTLHAPGLDLPLAPGTGDGDVATIHDQQAWRLTEWRTENSALTHRRFFTVTGLIGLRVEAPHVFEDVHRLTFDLVDRGIVQGLRLDHVDGLADPAGYLDRLRARLPETPIWVEKILTGDEALPPGWPVQGTTGYVAARSIARVLTDAKGAAALAEGAGDFRDTLAQAKDQIVTQELAPEVERLATLALAQPTEWGAPAWRTAIMAYVRAFPRYRTYATDTVAPDDERLIRDTIARATGPVPGALPALERLLFSPQGTELRTRLQQLTGAAIAKAQEDTAFYRWTPCLAANEVGAEPDEPALDPAGFHDAMARRQAQMPAALTLTSSHDTKRSEDARMRLAALTHDADGAAALRAMGDALDLPGHWGWYLAQSAFAAEPGGDLADRLAAHVEKAAREAKQDTFWTAPDPAFETRLTDAARALAARMDPLPDALRPLAARARALSLAQAALKLTIPGIPDIYQGTEIGSFRLTDPDNRNPIDFAALADPSGLAPFDAAKLDLTRTLLRLRRDRPEIATSPYAPRDARPGHLAFARGPLHVTVSTTGTPLADVPDTLWPDGRHADQPVALSLAP